MAHLEHLSSALQRKIRDNLFTGDEAVAIISALNDSNSTALMHSLACQNISLAKIMEKLIAQSNISIQLELIKHGQQ